MDDQLKRLESLANRLETVAKQISSNQTNNNEKSTDNIDNLPVIRDYETLINQSVKPFINLSEKIGGDLATMINHVSCLFNAQQQFIHQAVQCKKPTEQQMMDFIKPQAKEIESIIAFTNKNRKSPLFNHLSTISEGIPALSWILVSPTPGPHIKDMADASQFYSNRILKEFKEKDSTHAEWVKLWTQLLNDLRAYVKQHHTTGLAWASHGKLDFNAAKSPAGGSAPPPPPPPPPPLPPPPPPMNLDTISNPSADDSRDQLMSSINTLGQGITAHLKKVPDELKSHKNPQLRQQTENLSASNTKTPPAPPPRTGKSAVHAPTTKPPKLVLEGNKWLVEYQKNENHLRITDTNMKQSIYIYKCVNTTVQVEGKVNSIVLDQCNKVNLQFTSVVSLIEFVNCQNMKAQVLERVPTIQIEKTDGCHIYLSKTSLDTEFITSKSSEMSINIPYGDEGEFKEFPIAEQFKTIIQKGEKLVTMPSESTGV